MSRWWMLPFTARMRRVPTMKPPKMRIAMLFSRSVVVRVRGRGMVSAYGWGFQMLPPLMVLLLMVPLFVVFGW